MKATDGVIVAALGGLFVDLVGKVSADQLVSVAGTVFSVGSVSVAWFLAQRTKVANEALRREAEAREAKRHQDLLDAMNRIEIRRIEREADKPAEPPVQYAPDSRPSG